MDDLMEPRPTSDAQIYYYRAAGMSFQEIASRSGYDTGRVVAIYREYLVNAAKHFGLDKREQVIGLELSRLDMLQFPYFEQAIQGDHKSADTVLRIMNHRMKLLGLDQTTNETKTTNVLVVGTKEDFVEALQHGRMPALTGSLLDDEGDQEDS